jgi:hypothetical protein
MHAVCEIPLAEVGTIRCYLVRVDGDPVPECVTLAAGWSECTCDKADCSHRAAVLDATAA